ncbi:MAG: response regulator [Proteobacteria bacterium]|nr:response regulator [Pseudomonadota bacterium]
MVNKKKILIGSADPEFAFGIKSQLEGMGAFSPVLVTGARELIEVEQMFYFSVILVDALLDDLPGFEVCRKLREAGRNTPILLFSRIPEQECAKIRNSWQADRCLVKSVPFPDLFERIREVMEAKAKSPALEAQPGKRPAEQKEEKFDGLEEIVKEELMAEIDLEAKAEPEAGETPIAEEPETGEAPVAEEPPEDLAEQPRPVPESQPFPAAPAAPKTLSEEISSRLDELEEEKGPASGPVPVSSVEVRENDIPTVRDGGEETARESEADGGEEIIPEPEIAEEIEPIESEDLVEEETSKETSRGDSGLSAEEFLPQEDPEPVMTRKREMVVPAAYETGRDRARFVPWGSALKILVVLVGLGFGLGYFLAR